jgi:hydroxyacylglutathione hydrolase
MIVHREETITIFKSRLYETVTTVVQTNDMVLVTDPAWLPDEVAEIRDYVYAGLNGRPLFLLFTHSDYDHIIGYRAFPGAAIIASGAFADKTAAGKSDIVEQIRSFDDEYYLVRDYKIEYPAVDHRMDGDGRTLSVGGTRLVCYQAPGHNPDGLFTVVEPHGYLIAGDYFSDIEFPYIYHSSPLYEESIRKLDVILDNHPVGMLITGHGNFTRERPEMLRRQADALLYIQSMRDAVSRGDQEAIDSLITGCLFPRNMRKFHRGNQRLLEQELGMRTR